MLLEKNELLKIYGGGINTGIILGIGAGIVFLIGVIDGFIRPLACR